MSNSSRRSDRRSQSAAPADRLPPHSIEAEQGVLACCFLSPHECVPAARQKFGATQPLFDLGHAEIFQAICRLGDARKAVDVITVKQQLVDDGIPVSPERFAYLAGLPDKTGTHHNLATYLEIVCDKHLLRTLIHDCQRTVQDALAYEGNVDHLVTRQSKRFQEIEAQIYRDQSVTPTHIKTLDQFADEVYDAFFGSGADPEAGGWSLPMHNGRFPLRIRLGEMTFLLGEKGMGKSTMWSWFMIWLLQQGAKAFIASMEVRKRETIKKAICQLLGRDRLADLPDEHKVLQSAQAWMLPRCVLFDFLGIVPWRELLESMKRARAELGCNLFIIDSVMRIGVHAEDIAEADECAKHMADFATSQNVHVLLINHLNKSEGDAKKRSRGSYAWIDNSHNVCSVLRNQKKAEKIGEIFANWKAGVSGFKTIDERDAKLNHEDMRAEWDGRFFLHNQRLDGTQQNGSCNLWFDYHSGQYRDDFNEPSGVNLLARWTASARDTEKRKGEKT